MPLKMLSLCPEGHLTSVTWVSGPWSAIVQASWSSNQNQSNGDEENLNAETKGLLTDRTADRGGDHPDHRRDCYPEPVACTYCGERVVRCGIASHHQHGSDLIQLRLSNGGLCIHAGQSGGL